jgi:hypothetical protein
MEFAERVGRKPAIEDDPMAALEREEQAQQAKDEKAKDDEDKQD